MKLAVTLATIVALAGVASAERKEKAEALLKEGKKLMGGKGYSDA